MKLISCIRSLGRLRRVFYATAICLVATATLEAGPHRARLSRDLVDRLASGRTDTATVIVSGTAAEVQTIAERHGGRVTKLLRGAAVVEIAGDRLEGLAGDVEVAHLSGDVPVRRMMAVTSEAIGAGCERRTGLRRSQWIGRWRSSAGG